MSPPERLVGRLDIRRESDVGAASREAQRVAALEGFDAVKAAALATATSELARNALRYAGAGEVSISTLVCDGSEGFAIVVVVRDEGPGIADPASAMRDGWSTGGTLGLGLPSAQRLVDELVLESRAGVGTTVTIVKWR